MLNLLTAPPEKVDPSNHKAVAAGILKLIENKENHCQHTFGVTPDGKPLPSAIKSTYTEPLAQICLATAFTFVTGVGIPFGYQNYMVSEIAEFSQAVFHNKNICQVNNYSTHGSIIESLRAAAA